MCTARNSAGERNSAVTYIDASEYSHFDFTFSMITSAATVSMASVVGIVFGVIFGVAFLLVVAFLIYKKTKGKFSRTFLPICTL